MHTPPKRWRSPEELVEIGFSRSRVVMMNEAHSGLRRSVRCRRVGQRLLPAAHATGVRHLAMEALNTGFADDANSRRVVPHWPGYLGQPEMRDLISAALELGWTLVPYEADFDLKPAEFVNLSMEETNWREDQQAKNLVSALASLSDSKLLVWCGNSHHSKARGDDWIPMGVRFSERAGFDAFAIDQTRGVRFEAEPDYMEDWIATFQAEIGSGAGFVAEDRPDLWPDFGVDAFILSTDNDLT